MKLSQQWVVDNLHLYQVIKDYNLLSCWQYQTDFEKYRINIYVYITFQLGNGKDLVLTCFICLSQARSLISIKPFLTCLTFPSQARILLSFKVFLTCLMCLSKPQACFQLNCFRPASFACPKPDACISFVVVYYAYTQPGGHRDRMVVGFTCAISAYHN